MNVRADQEKHERDRCCHAHDQHRRGHNKDPRERAESAARRQIDRHLSERGLFDRRLGILVEELKDLLEIAIRAQLGLHGGHALAEAGEQFVATARGETGERLLDGAEIVVYIAII
jgi:hypothetical protein